VAQTIESIRNGVDTSRLAGTLDAFAAQPGLARFQFRASNTWLGGAHNRNHVRAFYGGLREDSTRPETFLVDADQPAILCGTDVAPSPAELLLAALASCLTTSLVHLAAERGVSLTEVTSTVDGDLDAQGGLGLAGEARTGFLSIRITFRVRGAAPAEELTRLVAEARSRSVVFDSVFRGVPVAVSTIAG